MLNSCSKQLKAYGFYLWVFFSVPVILLIVGNGTLLAQEVQTGRRPNVLFIAVDDLRPDLGCYGVTKINSPHIDRLAQKGMVFQNAYCQSAICGPSRASVLSGLRPNLSGVNDLFSSVRTLNPDIVTLPQLFKQHGYQAVSLGKIYHNNAQSRDPQSWSEKEWSPRAGVGRGYLLHHNQELAQKAANGVAAPYEMAEVHDTAYGDGKIAQRAIEWLSANKHKPFFLAVGFDKPHLPFNAPKKYWDLYRPDQITLPDEVLSGVVNNGIDKSLPKFPDFSNAWGELAQYEGIDKNKPVPPDMARMLKWGYYACISYIDAQVGLLLNALQRFGLHENTIVVLWGDHGYKLGEYGSWAKHTNLEIDTRAPLIMFTPGMKATGKQSHHLVEFIDIYPTLAELGQLPLPAHLQGKSFASILNNESLSHKPEAFSQFTDWNKTFCGYSVRTPEYRYTVWYSIKGDDSGKVIGKELYNLKQDANGRRNIAGDKKQRKQERKLHEIIIKENRLEKYVGRA